MHTLHYMKVMIEIPQRPPPQLEGAGWSAEFRTFVGRCLRKSPSAVRVQPAPPPTRKNQPLTRRFPRAFARLAACLHRAPFAQRATAADLLGDPWLQHPTNKAVLLPLLDRIDVARRVRMGTAAKPINLPRSGPVARARMASGGRRPHLPVCVCPVCVRRGAWGANRKGDASNAGTPNKSKAATLGTECLPAPRVSMVKPAR